MSYVIPGCRIISSVRSIEIINEALNKGLTIDQINSILKKRHKNVEMILKSEKRLVYYEKDAINKAFLNQCNLI